MENLNFCNKLGAVARSICERIGEKETASQDFNDEAACMPLGMERGRPERMAITRRHLVLPGSRKLSFS